MATSTASTHFTAELTISTGSPPFGSTFIVLPRAVTQTVAAAAFVHAPICETAPKPTAAQG